MGGFLYYIPKRTAESLIVDRVFKFDGISPHLSAVLKDVRKPIEDAAVTDVHGNGPDGTAGVLVAPIGKHTGGASLITVDPAKTDWYSADFGKYWIGWVKGEVPGPMELERPALVRGSAIVDAFSREWKIPISRSPFGEFGTLPKSFSFDAAGDPVEHVRRDAAWMWELGGHVNDQWAKDEPDFRWLTQQVPVILGINYRVGPGELSAMHEADRGILTEEFIGGVTVGFIHGSIVREAVEKKTEET